jgi:hypothetical protein
MSHIIDKIGFHIAQFLLLKDNIYRRKERNDNNNNKCQRRHKQAIHRLKDEVIFIGEIQQ